MSTMSATPMPMAPPEPPSPRMVATMGTGRTANSFMLSGDGLADAPVLSRDAGIGPGVSMKERMGRPNLAACRASRSALR